MGKLYIWSGAGNSFVVLDGRGIDAGEFRAPAAIGSLCREHGTDGLMILGGPCSQGSDFSMEFYNPDGSGGMMCGNGGRCIAAFADYLGIPPHDDRFVFDAPDGRHDAYILERTSPSRWTVRLRIVDVGGVQEMPDGLFLDTGTRHFVKFVPDVEEVDVETEGRAIRWREVFSPTGTNVNFVSCLPDGLHVRTFEKGVEGETLACGTGLTASAIAAWYNGRISPEVAGDGRVKISLKARRDWLEVDFLPTHEGGFTEVFLTGPAELLATI